MNSFHKPVLLKEVINYLKVSQNKKYIDATLGGGGHALAILKKGGFVLGIDQDQEALDYAKQKLFNYRSRLILVKDNFKNIDQIANKLNFDQVDGILFDLGVSDYQLSQSTRGFSFQREGKLDMRMDKSSPVDALTIVNRGSFNDLIRIFLKFGEEPLAEPLALSIIRCRRQEPINTTTQLAHLVEKVYRQFDKKGKIHSATKVFQALRIAVNNEIAVLKEGLKKAVVLLKKGGILVVISYHSLEDRITKMIMKTPSLKMITKKPVVPSFAEIKSNRKARSAKLRVAEKL